MQQATTRSHPDRRESLKRLSMGISVWAHGPARVLLRPPRAFPRRGWDVSRLP